MPVTVRTPPLIENRFQIARSVQYPNYHNLAVFSPVEDQIILKSADALPPQVGKTAVLRPPFDSNRRIVSNRDQKCLPWLR